MQTKGEGVRKEKTRGEGKEVKIPPNRWNIIQRIIRDYPMMAAELETMKKKSKYRDRLIRETEAVKEALTLFTDAERAVIQERFWTYEDKNKSYEDMWQQPFSARQMRRIAFRMVIEVGTRLGHISKDA